MVHLFRSPGARLAAVSLVIAATTTCREVDVTAVEAARVEITPVEPTVPVEQTIRLSARVLSEEGRALSGRSVSWESLNPELAEVDADGDVVGVAVGVASIRATSGSASATVEVTVTPGPAIQLAPSDAAFTAIQNGATPGDRTITVSNSGEGTLSGMTTEITYAAGQPTGWLSASLAATVAPTSLVLRADQTGLPTGVYNASVAVISPVATNAPVAVNVTLTVLSPQPAIALSATSVTFVSAVGGADPAQQTVSVTNVGGGTLSDLTAVVRYASGDPTGWLTATIGATAPTTLTLKATLGSLPAGTYEADVHVASSVAQNSPQFVHVTFTVGTALPAIAVDPATLTFAAASGGSDPTTQDVAITNAGGATLTELGISVVYPGGQPGGWVTQSLSETTAPATLTIGADVGTLAPGTYTATVLIASPVATNSPREVDVTLELAEAAPVIGVSSTTASFATTTSGGDPAAAVLDVTNTGGGTLSGLSTAIEYAAGGPTGWLSASLAAASAPTTLTLSVTKGTLGVGTYSATVRLASGGASNSPVEIVVTFTISNTPPSSPSALTARPESERRIDLGWTDNSDNESYFSVERSTSGGDFAEIGTPATGVTSFTDATGLSASTTYLYRVRACNAAGCSSPSSVVTATTAPARPSGLGATAVAPTLVRLSWTDNSTDETGFRIERSTGTDWLTIHTTGAGTRSYDDGGVVAATSYQYRVRACRNLVCSITSNTASVTTGVAIPGAPSSLATTAVSASRIDLSWNTASGSVDEYSIERRSGSGSFAEVTRLPSSARSYQNSGLAAGTSYTYRVRACNASGCSAPSNESSATTLPNAPGAPSGLDATTASSSRIDVEWNAASGTVGDYRLERAVGSSDDFELIATLPAGTLRYQDDEGLEAGTTYTYRVRACNTGGCSPYSGEDSATTLAPAPGAPAALTASVVSATQVHLAWDAATGSVSEYGIERRTGASGSWGQIASVASDSRTFESTGLSPSTEYFYRVRACNPGGCSGYSNEASATTLPLPPGAPSSLEATTFSSSQIELTWAAATGAVEEYVIERARGGTYTPIDTVASGTLTYRDTGLTPETTYSYRVKACNAGGCSGYSNEDAATTQPAIPTAPASLTANAVSTTEIDLSWGAGGGKIDEYRVERRAATGPFGEIATVPGSTLTFHDSGLSPAAEYTYRVRACNSAGCSPFSEEVTESTLPPAPGAPSSPTATEVSTSRIDLLWGAASGEVAEYRIERRTGVDESYAEIITLPAGTLSYQDTGLEPETQYFYRLRACNVSGCSDYSAEATAITHPPAPGAPAAVTATTVAPTQIDLGWSPATGRVTEYVVGRATVSGGPYTDVGTVTGGTFSFQDTGVSFDADYFYQVRACNITGCAAAGEVSATTRPPSAPGSLNAEAVGEDRIDVTWDAASGLVGEYRLERKLGSGGTYEEIATVTAEALVYSDTGVLNMTEYFYRVRACNPAGCSDYSGEDAAATADDDDTAAAVIERPNVALDR